MNVSESDDGSFDCECDEGFTGLLCGEDINECEETMPYDHGACMNTVGSFDCIC